MHLSSLLLLLVAQNASAPAAPPAPDREILVEAGEFERLGTTIRVDLPEEDGKKHWKLQDARGRAVPFQIDERGRAAFVVDKLASGAHTTYRLVEDRRKPASPPARVVVSDKEASMFRVSVDGKPVMTLQGRPVPPRPGIPPNLVRAGYIDPILTPAGAILTEAFPADQPRDLGLWTFWRDLEVRKQHVDFWDRAGTSGRIQMESLGPKWDGPVHGGFEARQIFTGLGSFGGLTLLREQWRVLVYAGLPGRASYFLFDLESDQAVQGDLPVVVSKADNGGVAVRGRTEWSKGPGGVLWMSSERAPQPERALWVYMGGTEKGKVAGIAVLGNPGNFDAPQALGKMAEGPVLNFSPNRHQSIPIEPNSPLRAHYRFVALDGKPDPRLLNRLSNDFSFPPRVVVRPLAAKQHPIAQP